MKRTSCPVGRCQESKCPKCGSHIDYNGNFFCHDLGNGCDWGLPAWPFDSSPSGGPFPMKDLRTVLVAIELGVINEQGDLL
jgi:hypothetical protein